MKFRALVAKNPKQLDIALKAVNDSGLKFQVELCRTNNGKVFYKVYALTTKSKFAELEERYRLFIG